jgi:hypothetical protein
MVGLPHHRRRTGFRRPRPGMGGCEPQLVGGEGRYPLGQRDHAPGARQGRRVVPCDAGLDDSVEAGSTHRDSGDARPTKILGERLDQVAPTLTRPPPSVHNRAAHRVDGTGRCRPSVRMAVKLCSGLGRETADVGLRPLRRGRTSSKSATPSGLGHRASSRAWRPPAPRRAAWCWWPCTARDAAFTLLETITAQNRKLVEIAAESADRASARGKPN